MGLGLELSAHMLFVFITHLVFAQPLTPDVAPPPPQHDAPTLFERPDPAPKVTTKVSPIRISGFVTFGLSYLAFTVPMMISQFSAAIRPTVNFGDMVSGGLIGLPLFVPVVGPSLAAFDAGDETLRTILFIDAGVQVVGLLMILFGRDEQILRWETKTAVFEIKPNAPQADVGLSLSIRW